ncbi:asparagine synthase [Psychromonas ingrahamii 37]|uniref:asparagine synthase (glutamine-hydrolyzing) n=1 Tax=Psychromonas ingrahamii (strain DSM 17664 / CCUG 51855 / 37) TaxID=357804 RepID=A1SY06_PSYIN|nr:asparagine synthase-related protein [Psychromonas ingrahamii]ABM04371.1 asparagine synthase [Psychromonas ingrahamii 37]
MSTLLGVIAKHNDVTIQPEWLGLMQQASKPFPYDVSGSIEFAQAIFSCQQRLNTPEAQYAKPINQLDKFYLLFDGRLDNREALANKLGVKISPELSDEMLVLSAYKQYQDKLCQHLLGDFVFVIYQPEKYQLLIARDHLGVRPLFITETNDFIAFASNKPALVALPYIDKTINEQWLADYITITKVEHHSSFYQEINSFPPASCLQLIDQKVHYQQYWRLDITHTLTEKTDDEYIAEFKCLLFEAVKCRLRCYGEIASELSGGLDSTSIASIAAILLNDHLPPNSNKKNIHAYSHRLAKQYQGNVFPFKDEGEYIDLLLSLYPNIQGHAIHSEEVGIIDELIYSDCVHAGPCRSDLSQFGKELFGAMQGQGYRSLLSGFGGDQLVTSQGNGWDIELVQKKQWQTLWRQAKYFTCNPLKRLKFCLGAIQRTYFSYRKFNFFISDWKILQKSCGINDMFAKKKGYPDRYFEHPTRDTSGTVKQQELKVIESAHVLYRLEDSAVGAASYGVDYRYPLLDVRLLQFCLALPAHIKVHNGIKRNMIRKATQDILPDDIRLRHDKSGATVPTSRLRIMYDQDIIIRRLMTTANNKLLCQYIDSDIIEQLILSLQENLAKRDDIKNKTLFRLVALQLNKLSRDNES